MQTFQGDHSSTTAVFKTQDKWEVQWDSSSRMAITLLSSNGAIVAGVSAFGTGSLYQAKGGSFYLQVNNSAVSPWHIRVMELPATNQTPDSSSANYAPPAAVSPSDQTNSVASASAPASNAPPAGPPEMTLDQSRAIVVIKGDAGEGTGFLAQTPDGPVVVTNSHVIAANPNVKIMTSAGTPITVLSLKGAIDRDLVMFAIKDDHYSYLTLGSDIDHSVLTDDEVLTPGNGEGGEVVLTTDGTVRGIGPDKVEVSNPFYHGNSGGPILHLKSGKVVGVVTQFQKVKLTSEFDLASYSNSKSAIIGTTRYFGLRLDSVPKWEAYDWNRFLDETTFLKQFHLQSRYLDSFLNGTRYEKAKLISEDPNDGPPNSHFFLQNDTLRSSFDDFHQSLGGADNSQKLDAQRELLMNLQVFANKDMTTIESPGNFYSFDRIRAKEEIVYRNALKTELDTFGNKMSDLGH